MKSDWAVRPERYFAYLRKKLGITQDQMKVPQRLVLVFSDEDLRSIRRLFLAKPHLWNRWLYVGRAGRHNVAVLRSMIGAPATAIALEEMIALGATHIMTFGACGSLLPRYPIGSVLIPLRAYSDEGTSRHYDGARWAKPDPSLVRRVREACLNRSLSFGEGGVWTTDAPYRESFTKARSLARRGVVSVDMEASAVYAVARERKIHAASLFVVSDELGGAEWNAGFQDAAFRRSKRRAYQVIGDVMAGALP